MPITYLKDGTPYFKDPLTDEEQRLKDEVFGDVFKPPVGMTSLQSWGRAKARAKAEERRREEEGHKDGEEA
jgi:hypothetical protein